MSPAIETEGLSKRYDEEVAVNDLSVSIDPGTVYGFLGPNGAGKTTTMRMLTTLTRPTSGTARVAGASIEDRDTVTPHIGYLPDEPPLYDELTGREQLTYIAGLRDLPEAETHERMTDLFDRFDLLEDADKRIDSYSTGMRKKLGIMQAVIHHPRVVFLDEPTTGLDPRAARTMRDTIAELAAREMTIFLSTHILPVVDELADSVGVIHEGRLVAEGAPEELKRRAETGEQRSLEDAFLDVTHDTPETNVPTR
ncbi:trehalose/maltose import ATP-binding protein MalK [Halalkalicoccus paucihalophilus]|uniref:Trehalose/maltose import ATP-binding protein MalK n=1 Tax=Halalkalicoccus paucihalophilus TaxID=1008153 RepID=A0A151AG16_9EURY|nr:ABC transporter ATP-binding protein [Halalkalicoccus paucihalophilus]KYH26540.1 trehalose/maltose import ATP-binding protein MalK [Halalkalicoccus paucihalophilus]